MERHFDRISEAYYDIVDRVWYEYGYCHQRELAFLRRVLRARPRIALDAGCGPGRHTAVLASAADRVLAIDVSRKMLELARRSVAATPSATVDFIQADVRHLPLKTCALDFIANFEVLEHLLGGITDINKTFMEFRRVLEPGGSLVTEVPLRRHLLMSMIAPSSLKEILPQERQRFYEEFRLPVADAQHEDKVDRLLRSAGFDWELKEFVQVVPAGLVERFPPIIKLDEILEKAPVVRKFAREAIWLAHAV